MHRSIMKLKHLLLAAFAVVALVACSSSKSMKVIVTNPLDTDRVGELVEVYQDDVHTKLRIYNDKTFVVLDSEGKQVPYQITNDGTVLFPASVKAGSEAEYTIQEGEPIKPEQVAYGNVYPKRVDDIAFENDRIGWRIYGPAAQRRGDRLFGYDIWDKKVSYPILDSLYEQDRILNAKKAEYRQQGKRMSAEEERSMSYHVDHGIGCDYYNVGATLGAGVAAFYSPATGALNYPWCYKDYMILDNGPLRFTVRLTYDLEVNGVRVQETRLISLDKGSQMARCEVWYSNIFTPMPLAAGVVMHTGSDVVTHSAADGYAAYADPTDPVNGTNYLGLAFPDGVQETKVQPLPEEERAKAQGVTGHLLGITTYSPDQHYVYYFGAGWSKYGFDSFDEWAQYVKGFAARVRQPLQVKFK